MVFFTMVYSSAFALEPRDFLSPLDYQATVKDKRHVVSYIHEYVYDVQKHKGFRTEQMKEASEIAEWNAFNQLLNVRRSELLREQVDSVCRIQLCSYQMVLMLYDAALTSEDYELNGSERADDISELDDL